MNLEYQITFQDDLDCQEVFREYQFNKKWLQYLSHPLLWLLSSSLFLVLGIFETSEIDKSAFYTLSIVIFISGIYLYFIRNPQNSQSYLSRITMQSKWKKKPSQQEYRSFTTTDDEFIFKTDVAEFAWKWTILTDAFEGDKGFMLCFAIGHNQYIPKRIFNQQEIKNFREIMQKKYD